MGIGRNSAPTSGGVSATAGCSSCGGGRESHRGSIGSTGIFARMAIRKRRARRKAVGPVLRILVEARPNAGRGNHSRSVCQWTALSNSQHGLRRDQGAPGTIPETNPKAVVEARAAIAKVQAGIHRDFIAIYGSSFWRFDWV